MLLYSHSDLAFPLAKLQVTFSRAGDDNSTFVLCHWLSSVIFIPLVFVMLSVSKNRNMALARLPSMVGKLVVHRDLSFASAETVNWENFFSSPGSGQNKGTGIADVEVLLSYHLLRVIDITFFCHPRKSHFLISVLGYFW